MSVAPNDFNSAQTAYTQQFLCFTLYSSGLHSLLLCLVTIHNTNIMQEKEVTFALLAISVIACDQVMLSVLIFILSSMVEADDPTYCFLILR